MRAGSSVDVVHTGSVGVAGLCGLAYVAAYRMCRNPRRQAGFVRIWRVVYAATYATYRLTTCAGWSNEHVTSLVCGDIRNLPLLLSEILVL